VVAFRDWETTRTFPINKIIVSKRKFGIIGSVDRAAQKKSEWGGIPASSTRTFRVAMILLKIV
jgi:hypothetical protein